MPRYPSSKRRESLFHNWVKICHFNFLSLNGISKNQVLHSLLLAFLSLSNKDFRETGSGGGGGGWLVVV